MTALIEWLRCGIELWHKSTNRSVTHSRQVRWQARLQPFPVSRKINLVSWQRERARERTREQERVRDRQIQRGKEAQSIWALKIHKQILIFSIWEHLYFYLKDDWPVNCSVCGHLFTTINSLGRAGFKQRLVRQKPKITEIRPHPTYCCKGCFSRCRGGTQFTIFKSIYQYLSGWKCRRKV